MSSYQKIPPWGVNERLMVSTINRPEPGKIHKRSVPFPALARRASPRLAAAAAAAARDRKAVPVRIPHRIALKRASSIMEVVFKNVFLKGAVESVESQREGRAAPTDLGPGAPNKLWEVIVQGAEHEAKNYFKPLGPVSGQDVVFLIHDTFGLHGIRPEAKIILEWNFKRIWGFSHEYWHRKSTELKAFAITDVSYKDLIEIGTLAFGTDEQKEAMGFKRGCGWRL